MLLIEMVTGMPPAVLGANQQLIYLSQHLQLYQAGAQQRLMDNLDKSAGC